MSGAAQYVSFDRWDEAHRDLVRRVERLEALVNGTSRAALERAGLTARVAALEDAAGTGQAKRTRKRERMWLLIMGLATGIVAPVVVTGILALLHTGST